MVKDLLPPYTASDASIIKATIFSQKVILQLQSEIQKATLPKVKLALNERQPHEQMQIKSQPKILIACREQQEG